MHLVAIGGSDAGISAGLRARELDPTAEVTVVVADAYPNFSICGIPYYISGEVTHWRNLAHRSVADLEGAGLTLRLDTVATAIDVLGRRVAVREPGGSEKWLTYDELVVGTGALPVHPPIGGLDELGETPAFSSAPVHAPAPGAPSSSTRPCAPGFRTSGRPATACTPITGSSASPTSRSARPLTRRAGWRARTQWAGPPDSPAVWVPRS